MGGSAVLGALIGSFLNVVIHRAPAGVSVVHPPSGCPACGNRIRPYDNIPILSWLVLRGRCRDCATPISPRYPLVEAGTAIAFGLVAAWMLSPLSPAGAIVADAGPWGLLAGGLLLAAYLWLAAASIALTAIDLETHRLPNIIVLPGYGVAVVGLVTPALLAGDLERLGTMAAGAGILFAAYALMAVAWPGGMGMGDVKLAGVLGAFLGFSGWAALIVGAFGAFVLGGIVSIVLLAMRRVSRKGGIPFGPWMIAGTWVGLVLGASIAGSYLSLFGIELV
ncbi:prepilin peptidase [Microcella alkalica]|uniref:Prepilin leader peptidase/N-methyltransferase n=2 Tax=Microcella alkalica TaxID=355930 RepID=A0A839EAL1_9MICO|nr:A24 family peptidase [Microcella alkalica]MBA8848770.1 leader peptidase (prepilin peptidase)/N-methyltransferase [Microcella alkalica]